MLSVLCLFGKIGTAQSVHVQNNTSIVIQVKLPNNVEKQSAVLEYMPYNIIRPEWKIGKPEIEGNVAKWSLVANGPLFVALKPLPSVKVNHLYEPGDSLHIDFTRGENREIYSGRGAGKFIMQQEIFTKLALVPVPKNKSFSKTTSLDDYQEWNSYLNAKLVIIDNIMTTYKTDVTPLAYDYLRTKIVSEIEYQRGMKFGDMVYWPTDKRIASEELGKIFDTTILNKYSKWLQNYRGTVSNSYYFYDLVRKSVQRKYNFNTSHPDLEGPGRKVLYADLGKKIYSGEVLQGFLVFLLTESGLKDHILKQSHDPNNVKIEKLLDEFYAMPGYPDHKAYVKAYEEMIRGWVVGKGHTAPDFILDNGKGKSYRMKDLKGKIVLLGFFDDSRESTEMLATIKKVQTLLLNNKDVVFLNVFTTKGRAVGTNNFFVEKEHLILKNYNLKDYPQFNIKAFPKIFALDGQGNFMYGGEISKSFFTAPLTRRSDDELFPDPRKDNSRRLINDIYEQFAILKDGPYVFHEKDGLTSYHIHSSKVAEQKYPVGGNIIVDAQTDDFRKTFSVPLRNNLTTEAAVNPSRPEKLFILSDIEGEFKAFRKLLQSNKIIDDQFNWTFGKGHLVFAGDMFDRGLQVTECLWLVYALEEKAKKAGGYVHFVLGNHEIMNLQGNHRYVKEKYQENAKLLGKTITELYSEDSELGRWLRTKNIVEKIGDLLFLHGGVSSELNEAPLTVEQINTTARPFYADSKAAENPDSKVSQLYNNMTSPFWYRLYYNESQKRGIYKAMESQVDSTLQKFNVKHIITGHTIVADTITTHYNNKVINTDTKHASGKSEALLIEGANFYRVNAEGKRALLFKDEEK